MNTGTFFSPSYIGDLDRMIWLRRSIDAFHTGCAKHIIAVPRKDFGAFRNALGEAGEIEYVYQEDLVDPGFYPDALYRLISKILPSQAWRAQGHAGKPGWIIQQIVKLSANALITDGPIVFLDSDLFFFRPFTLEKDLGLTADKRILVRAHPDEEGAKHRRHLANARRFLGLPPGPTDATYMGYPAIWYPDWLSALQQYIEKFKEQPWQRAMLAADFSISEYTIYGVFIDEILRPGSLNVQEEPFNLIAWDPTSFQQLKSDIMNGKPLPDGKVTLCLQSNLHIPVDNYVDMLRAVLQRHTQASK